MRVDCSAFDLFMAWGAYPQDEQPFVNILFDGEGFRASLGGWVLMGRGCRQSLLLQDGVLWVNGVQTEKPTQAVLEIALRELKQQTKHWPDSPSPFSGGLVGYWGYESAGYLEPAVQHSGHGQENSEFPDVALFECETWLLFHPETGEMYQMPEAQALLSLDVNPLLQITSQSAVETSFSPESFHNAVEQVQNAIVQGDLYQANVAIRFEKTLEVPEPWQQIPLLYQRLCEQNPSPFSALLGWQLPPENNPRWICSNSPERLVQVDATGRVRTRPIAGTRGRGRSVAEDEELAQTLQHNPKEQAEHLMLVDLERNDLGRVCVPGSVTVTELLGIERYSHVTHLVSNVEGTLEKGRDWLDVLRALFPGGTITGCPKVRCMQLLSGIEPVNRGPYTGSLGWVDGQSEQMDWNILIRTLMLSPLLSLQPFAYNDGVPYTARFYAGAGIVQDSVATHEYKECFRKASLILEVLETLHKAALDKTVKGAETWCNPV